jgi:predicted TPR repeat methyltransferase
LPSSERSESPTDLTAFGRYERALALHRAGQLGEADALYREVLTSDPAHFGALHLLGVIEAQRGRYAEAVPLIEQAIRVDPGVAAAHANLGNAECALGLLEKALASYQRALTLQPGHRWALMGQGKVCWSLGRLTEALASYEAALDIEPACSESLTSRGDILLKLGRLDEGVASLRRAVACGADPEPIRFVLASIGQETAPLMAPPGYVKNLFDKYADRFDAELVHVLRYRTPELLERLVLRHSPRAPLDILDLGCGTGLCGQLMRPIARRLTGVDLSGNMLAHARDRDVYSELECIELTDYLARCAAEFDLVVAADVFIYLGDLTPVFDGVRRALRAGGCMAFSVEAGEQQEFELAVTRRYRHARPYLERLAAEYGFAVDAIETGVLRREAGSDVNGHLALLRLAGNR